MLDLIRAAPLLAAVLLPLLGGGLAGGLQELRYNWIEIPHRLELQRVALEEEYRRRVAEAIAAEQLRQFGIIERMTTAWQKALDEELAWRDARVELLEQEIADYETAEGDTACKLDQGDVDFLLGLAGIRRELQPDTRPPG